MKGRMNETLTAGNQAICFRSMILACSGGRTEHRKHSGFAVCDEIYAFTPKIPNKEQIT